MKDTLSAGNNRILRNLWQVVSAYQDRVLSALLLLVLAKVATVGVPLMLKRIVDELSRPETVHALPVLMLSGYAILRFSSTLFNELRDLLFSRVTQQTVAVYAEKTFSHLHALGASFHARRQLGGFLPSIDRGTAVTFLLYTGFTLVFTGRRAIFQRRVNRLDTNAKSRLADSLINAENCSISCAESPTSTNRPACPTCSFEKPKCHSTMSISSTAPAVPSRMTSVSPSLPAPR